MNHRTAHVLALAFFCLASAGAAQVVVEARPSQSAGSLFGPAEYPAAARAQGAQGRVVARLAIDKWGEVTDCVVIASSGSVDLDAATCRIAKARVRFTPARDAKGRAIASSYTLPVRWVLPGAAPASGPVEQDPPGQPGDVADVALVLKDADPGGQVVTVDLEVDERGKLATCKVLAATGSPGIAAKACRQIERRIAFRPAIKAGLPVRRTTVQRVLFRPPFTDKPGQRAPELARTGGAEGWIASEDYPAASLRLGKEGVTAIAWEVTEAGAVENCRVTASSGFAELDRAACDAVTRRARFEPTLDATGKPIRSTREQKVHWRLPH